MASAQERVDRLKLSEQQLAAYRKKFNAFDLKKDGVITMREFAAVSKVFGYKLSKEEIMEIFQRTDLDLSGGISFNEFILAMHARGQKAKVRGQQMAPYREAFRMFDTKNKGYISAEEAYPILYHELGFDMEKTEQIIEQFDKNRDYRLSLPEFIPFFDKLKQLKLITRQQFDKLDVNGDGYIDRAEAVKMLEPDGFVEARRHIVYNDIERVFERFDRDKDGLLSYTEFAAFWSVPLNAQL